MEIRTVDGVNISDIPLCDVKEIRKRLNESGILVWSVGSPIGKISADDAFAPHMEKLKHTLESACELGAENIRIFSFYIPEGKPALHCRGCVMDRLNCMAEEAAKYSITLCHENEKGIYGQTAALCEDIAKAVPAIAHVFDPANYVQSGINALDAWNRMEKYVKYVHIKDALSDGSVVPAGEGVCEIHKILARFRAAGGRRITLEPHLSVFDGFGALEREAGAESRLGTHMYKTQRAAFDAGVGALMRILQNK